MPIRMLVAAGLGAALAGALMLTSCRSTRPNLDPVGAVFPSVTGESLAGETVALPPGEPAILLVGYVQDAQFDADRWLIGLLQVAPPARILEVPTIEGMVPRMISGTIDSGMRSGIPSEDWGSVVTVYGGGAEAIVALTGDTTPRNMRVFLLDVDGRVAWFHDRGFSAARLLDLDRAARALAGR